MRTSSATNCGEDKDSDKRQEQVCRDYCQTNSLQVVDLFYDEGVTGKMSVLQRGGFKQLYHFCLDQDIRNIVFESNSRFARDLVEAELAYRKLKKDGFNLISATSGEMDNSAHSEFIRQIMGSIAELQRKELVFNLEVARKRKKLENKKKGYLTIDGQGKCEGRRSWSEINAKVVKEAKRLRRKNWKTGKVRSYRKIATELDKMGFKNSRGSKFNAKSIQSMLNQ